MRVGCPNVAEHTPHPTSYMAHSAWAQGRMDEGWTQRECDGCGLHVIWVEPESEPKP